MNVDVARGLAGFLVLVVAGAAVAGYDAARFDERPLAWTTSESLAHVADGELLEGERHDEAVTIEGPNVQLVRFRLTWQDDVGDGDAFSMVVRGPQGQNASVEPDGAGEIAIEVPVAAPPASVSAPNEAAAQHLAALLVDAASGVGPWTVSITLDAAPGAALPAGPLETQADGRNTYALSVEVVTYAVAAG